MALVAQLLGPPTVARDGAPCPAPRGRKVWALFAYLALSARPPTRQLLADLLFPEADDPASALRWNLSELRRLLGGPETVGSGTTRRAPAAERLGGRRAGADRGYERRGRRPARARARTPGGSRRRGQPRVHRVAARRAQATAGARRLGLARERPQGARRRESPSRRRARHPPARCRSPRRGRARAPRPRVRGDGRRGRGRTSAERVARAVPARARDGARGRAVRGRTDRGEPTADGAAAAVGRRCVRCWRRAKPAVGAGAVDVGIDMFRRAVAEAGENADDPSLEAEDAPRARRRTGARRQGPGRGGLRSPAPGDRFG